MEFKEIYSSEPKKYWQAPKGSTIPNEIMTKPELYSNYITMEKRDGEWARIIVDENQNVTIQSRSVSTVTGTYGDKTLHVPHLVEILKELPPNTVLLGELCFKNRKKTSKDVGTILRCLPAKAVQRQKDGNFLHLSIFDCLWFNGENLMDKEFKMRFSTAFCCYEMLNNDLIFIPMYCDGTKTPEMVESIWKDGGEGVVLVRKDSIYKPGSRTARESIKLKKTTGEIEVKVIGVLEPTKEYTGKELDNWNYWIQEYRVPASDPQPISITIVPVGNNIRIKSINYRYIPVTKPYYYGWKSGIIVSHNGTEVSVASGLTDQDREWLSTPEAADSIATGKLYAVVTAMEIDTASGSLRHPQLIRLRDET